MDEELKKRLREQILAQVRTPQPKKESFITRNLPTIGAIGAGLLAAPLTGGLSLLPSIAVAGGAAAAGAGLGEVTRQGVTTGKISDPEKLYREMLYGGIGGGAGPIIGKVGGKIVSKIGGGLEKAGSKVISSQANIPRQTARALDLPGTVKTLSRYGINNIDDYSKVAHQVTGSDGIVTKLVREAVGKAKPVDTSGVMELTKNIAANPNLDENMAKRFTTFVTKGLSNVYGGPKGSLATKANPTDLFDFIKGLQTKAAELTVGRNPISITSADKALANSYHMLADELEERLFTSAGANANVSKLMTPDTLAKLTNIAPKNKQWGNFINDFMSSKTVKDLRSLQKPFVNASKIATETEMGNNLATAGFGGAYKGASRFIPSVADPLAPVKAIAETPQSSALIGTGLNKAGSIVKRLPGITGGVGTLAGAQIAARAGSAVSDTGLPGETASFDGSPTQPQPTGAFTEEGLRQAMLADLTTTGGKNIDFLKQVAELYGIGATKPLSVEGQKMFNLGKAGLDSLNEAANLFSPSTLVKGKATFGLGTRQYDSAMFSAVDNLLRLKTGAQAPESEVRRYMKNYAPRLGDSQETIMAKFRRLKDEFESAMGVGQTSYAQ